MFSAQVLVGTADIAEIADEWDDLFARAGQAQQVFQRRPFLDLWMRHFADARNEPVVVAGRVQGRLAALLPLVRQKRLGFTVLRSMGLPVAQFADGIAEPDLPPVLTGELWDAVSGLGADLMEMRRVREDAALHRILPATTYVYEDQEAPFTCLKGRVEGVEPGPAYSAKYRSNQRRRGRRLAEQGAVELVAGAKGEAARELVSSAMKMKRLWLKHHSLRSPAVHDERFSAFFRDAATTAGSGLLVSAILLDEQPVAVDLSFANGGTCFGHVLAIDPDREEQGLGALMVHQAFASATAAGNDTFDLLPPSNAHKLGHSDGVTKVRSHAYAFTPAGRLACGLLARNALPAAKELAARLPAPMVDWLGRRL